MGRQHLLSVELVDDDHVVLNPVDHVRTLRVRRKAGDAHDPRRVG